jgi:DNA-binding NarL/FixJ family response regulator
VSVLPEKYRTNIVDPEGSSRLKLKRAAEESSLFEDVGMFDTIAGAQRAFVSDSKCDIVFVSYRFPLSESSSFLNSVRTLSSGKDTVFVLVSENVCDPTVVSRHVAAGFSGFLVEPYSLEALNEIVTLAKKIRVQLSSTAEESMLRMLVRDIFGKFDITVALRRASIEPRESKRLLHESCEVLPGLPKEQLELFYSYAAEYLDERKCMQLLPEGYRYIGQSRRVPIQVEKDLLRNLQEQLKIVE